MRITKKQVVKVNQRIFDLGCALITAVYCEDVNTGEKVLTRLTMKEGQMNYWLPDAQNNSYDYIEQIIYEATCTTELRRKIGLV